MERERFFTNTNKGMRIAVDVTPFRGFFMMSAWALDGTFTGYLVAFHRGGNRVQVGSVNVAEQFQRRGIATALYDWMDERFTVEPDTEHQTDDGRAFWAARRSNE